MSNYRIRLLTVVFLIFTAVTLVACTRDDVTIEDESQGANNNDTKMEKMIITVGSHTLEVELVKNSSVDALIESLKQAPITVDMSDYGNMEKVGSLGQSFPRNDTHITTQAGDVILYQGNMLVIYYAPNTWSFTRLGKIENISATQLKSILGSGDVTVTLSLPTP